MANGVDVLAASRYAALLAMSFIASFAEERSIYLVLMEGEPVAFHGDILPRQHGRRFDPQYVKDAVNLNGTFPRAPQYVEECQYPEALDLDPNVVRSSIVICTFSAGFYNETSTP